MTGRSTLFRDHLTSAARFFTAVAAVLVLLVTAVPLAHAQVTTGAISGTVTDPDGGALPGVTVEAIHVPTGTRYDTVTGSNGRFVIPNVRVGGPYKITATLEGFKSAESTGTQVALGTTAEVPLQMRLAAVTEAITVTATADQVINPNRVGSESQVTTEQIETLPTINRSLQDYARMNPYFMVQPSDQASALQVAGRNNRYNSIQIDGAVNNDLFGLAASGTPGGQSDAQPISLEAIEQLQLVISPYDVRQSGFTGGGINAVSRSGTNDFDGSVFGNTRSEQFVGDGPLDRPLAEFSNDRYGGRLGGPILKDKLFFFVSGELSRREAPSGVSATGDAATQVNAGLKADLEKVASLLQSRYNYDAGSLAEINAQTNSDSFFGRADWNIGGSNQLTLRHNYNKGFRDALGTRSSSRFTFGNSNYQQSNETNQTVGQLNSIFSANAYNEARVSYQTIRDERATPVTFPAIEIGGAAQNATITAGTERFSGANALDQNILAITDDFTLLRGAHTLIFGTHNEIFDFKNLFMSDSFGAYFFPNVAAFEANTPSEYRITFATGSDPRRPTAFKAAQYGVYVNDQWRMSSNLTLTGGLRVDMPSFPDRPTYNPVVDNAIGLRTDAKPASDPIISPRIGFNWNPGGTEQQIRGGIGIFAGRAPFVWVSNAYAGTGVEQVSLTCLASAKCPVPAFTADPFNQPKNVGTAGAPGTLTVDVTDPDFKFPRVLRATLGYDRQLFWGVRGTIEGVLSQTQQDVFYYNMNRVATGATNPLDGRPQFAKKNTTDLSDAYYLTNTSKGQEQMASLQLARPFRNGSFNVSYTWQNAESAFDATSSRAVSNWRFRHTAGDIFQQDVSRSAFEVEHRLSANFSYNFHTGPITHTFGAYYNMQSGAPFSTIAGNDANGDLNNSNDLLYIPKQGEVIYQFSNGTTSRTNSTTGAVETAEQVWNALMNKIGADPYAGRITDRYEFQSPWTRRLDLHYELGTSIRGIRSALTFDVLNALNLIDKEYGIVYYIPNQNSTVATVQSSKDPATGKYILREAASGRWTPDRFFSIADNSSRWQGQVGVRFSF